MVVGVTGKGGFSIIVIIVSSRSLFLVFAAVAAAVAAAVIVAVDAKLTSSELDFFLLVDVTDPDLLATFVVTLTGAIIPGSLADEVATTAPLLFLCFCFDAAALEYS